MHDAQKEIRRVDHLQNEIENAFSELIHDRWAGTDSKWLPAIDFYETDDAFLIQADLPGMDPEQVKLEAREKSVTICGIRLNMVSINKGRRVMTERASGKFCRTIQLSETIDVQKAKAQFKEGVYEIYLPKKR